MKTQIAATKRFYDQLDPAQKSAFDELPLMMGGPPMPMMARDEDHASPHAADAAACAPVAAGAAAS